MVERVEAIVKRELLAWARKSAGFDLLVAAKKMGTTEERLLSWEAGERHPTITQLRKMGEVYKRPIAVFYLPVPPKGFDPIKDFRHISEKERQEYSPTLLLEIRRAYSRRESAIELYKDLEGTVPPSKLQIKISDETEAAGTKVREFLGITNEKQMLWSDDRHSFNGWRAAIENKDILVFQASRIPLKEMRGFSISKSPIPAIVVNIQDAVVARTFTLLHELTHVLIGKEGVCDLTGDAEIEVFCNAVAGAALVPRDSLLVQPELQQKRAASGWVDEEMSSLAHRYKVSREVILRRLLTVGRISAAFYKTKSAQYKELRKKHALITKQRKSGFAPPDRKAVSSFGKLFSRLVLNSYHHEKITASDVSDLLSVKINYLPKIEMAIFG